jgi:hypothetical protein
VNLGDNDRKHVSKKMNGIFLRKKNIPEKLERVLVRSILERISLLLERGFFLKKGQSLFWNAFFTVFFYGYFSLGIQRIMTIYIGGPPEGN